MHTYLTFGGKNINLALYKIAINFFIYSGGDEKYIKHLINCLLQNNINNTNGYSKQISIKNTDNIKENYIPHIIYIEGNSEENILYAYIEFFGTIQFLVLLNNNYNGVDIKYTYCYDFIPKSEINISSFNLELDYNKIRNNQYDIDLEISNDLFNRFKYLLHMKSLLYKLNDKDLSSEEKYDLYTEIGGLYYKLDLHYKAIKYYTYAININSLYGYTYYIRGSIYFLLEDDKNCINDYIRYLNLITRISYDELMLLAKIFATIKKYKYAISCYIRAISMNNNSKEIYKELADLYTELGNFTNAYKYYECSLKLDNNYYNAYTGRLTLFIKKYFNVSDRKDILKIYNNIVFANNLVNNLKDNSIELNIAISDIDNILSIKYDYNLLELKNDLLELLSIIEE